tara:strand:+ start:115 stop:546 length:432 start_codon:yes stop_codon:yes gene_type:complete
MDYRHNNKTTKMITVFMILSLILPSTIVFGHDSSTPHTHGETDYYYEGQAAAERDYQGGGAMIGGLGAGVVLGLIGWGLGYLVVSNQGVDVPHHYISELDTKQRIQFEEGYKKTVKKSRNGKYNMGAGVGTLLAIVIVLNANP